MPRHRVITPIAAKKSRRAARSAARRAGRPSTSAALLLRDRILQVATEHFLTHGYGLTSIEAVARAAGVSKRTFYHRFADKSALFKAVVHGIIERIRPPRGVELLQGASLHETLRRLGRLIIEAALSPPAIALHRLLVAESARFPELARAIQTEGTSEEAVALISGQLAKGIDNAQLDTAACRYAAQQFLELLIAIPQRRALGFDAPMSPGELDAWADAAVTLLLNGCRGWRKA